MNIKDLTYAELEEFVLSIGEAKFRAKQIFKWAYQKRLDNFDEMTNMPKPLRARLASLASLDKLETRCIIESPRGDAVKFGFALGDGSGYVIESVLLIDGDRRTACLSSQLGCALGCVFCETGKLGFIRDLTQAEIVGQLIGINDYLYNKEDKLVTNIVFMGMGEALSNFKNFTAALSVVMSEDAFNIGARRVTVSTAGVVPSIEKLMREDLAIGLAISLNAWNDEMRSETMPVNKAYPIARLVDIAKKYHAKTGRRVTFEYVLMEGVTDTPEAAAALTALLGGFPCKINLIPINPISFFGGDGGYPNASNPKSFGDGGYPRNAPPQTDYPNTHNLKPLRGQKFPSGNFSTLKYKSPDDGAVEKFAGELHRRGLAATIRRSRGQDIMGACGQLTASFDVGGVAGA